MNSIEEMIQELQQLKSIKNDSEGWTLREIMDSTGWSKFKASKFLYSASKLNLLKVTEKSILNIAGRTSTVPCYTWQGKSKAKQKKL